MQETNQRIHSPDLLRRQTFTCADCCYMDYVLMLQSSVGLAGLS